MYAHHVLKDFVKYDRIIDTGNDILSLVKTSTKYHFGDLLTDIFSIMEPVMTKFENDTNAPFFPSKEVGVVSPYDTVWFDWRAKDKPHLPKYASLILKTPHPLNKKVDFLTVYHFFYSGAAKKWRLLPIKSFVDCEIKKTKSSWTEQKEGDYTKETIDATLDLEEHMLACVFMCLLFINCKNVETHKRLPDEKLQKKRKKYGKLPMFSYHVLEIKDMRKKDIYPEDHTPTKMGKLRYHQMPARVVYYTKEKPLFGNPKLTGWYAFKSYWRGDPNKGMVIRDYARKEDTTQNLVLP